jgi:RNA polymerase sigma-70 factor (ECF subfamily)
MDMLSPQAEMDWPMRGQNFLSSMFGMTDEQAMWRVQTEEDHRAFARLVERWEKPILRLCQRMVGDVHRAEDLKQETFSRVFGRRKDYQTNRKFSTWLWRIALNLCYDELRRTERQAKHLVERGDAGIERDELPAEEQTPYLRLAQQEEEGLVRAALQGLDETLRTVVVLRYCEGLKLREIAEVLELPESTINSRVAAGLARLTRILEPQFEERKL